MPQWLDTKISLGNLIWIAVLLVGIGRLLAQIDSQQFTIADLSDRLDKKVQIQNDQEDTLHDLELRVIVLETTPH